MLWENSFVLTHVLCDIGDATVEQSSFIQHVIRLGRFRPATYCCTSSAIGNVRPGRSEGIKVTQTRYANTPSGRARQDVVPGAGGGRTPDMLSWFAIARSAKIRIPFRVEFIA